MAVDTFSWSISIHALTRSATPINSFSSWSFDDFNPRTHKECDGILKDGRPSRQRFQSTHSQGVRHDEMRALSADDVISIHALTRSATPRCHQTLRGLPISIHALTRSATAVPKAKFLPLIYFNPRTHKECDLIEKLQKRQNKFQSTHSQGVRLGYDAITCMNRRFQSTHSQGVRR